MTDPIRWLCELGLPQYAEAFERNDVDAELLPRLTDADLRDIGVQSLGHRRRLLDAIALLSAPGAAAQPTTSTPPAATDAERRQLTVLFCDLVGSTELSLRLDPEELRRLIRQYQDTCLAAITRFQGFVAQFLGDGVLAYFGYPTAHEAEAERAIGAGLALLERVEELSRGARERLQVRIGIDTGLVVIGGREGREDQGHTAIGDAPNLAARLQALAAPGTIAVTERTRQLAAGAFRYADLGQHALKSIPEPVRVWAVLGPSAVGSRFEAATGGRFAPIVGREEELAALSALWDKATRGEGKVVLLAGEPGIGKSALMNALRANIQGTASAILALQCNPLYSDSALQPVIEHLERAFGFERGDDAEVKLAKLEHAVVEQAQRPRLDAALLASLLNLPHSSRFPALQLAPLKQKEETLRALADLLVAVVDAKPALFMVEDVHWSDPTTLESLDRLIERTPRMPLLLVLSHRPDFKPPWLDHPGVTALRLGRLRPVHSRQIVERVCGGKVLPAELSQQIEQKTDGVPLFVEELTKSILESGALREAGDRYELTAPLPAVEIPSTLRNSLAARLDRLASAKEVAQIGACIGRQFRLELLKLVSPLRDAELERALAQLVDSELVFQRGVGPQASYGFKHALVQDAAYDSMLRSRRAQLHAQIAQALARHFPEMAESEPETLAHHCTNAGLHDQAFGYWQRAGRRAVARSAYREAIAHFRRALGSLATLPDDRERARNEIELQVELGNALIPLLGWSAAETGEAFSRAQALSTELGEESSGNLVLGLLWFRLLRAEYDDASALAQRAVALAERDSDPWLSAEAHVGLGCSHVLTGRSSDAIENLRLALTHYDAAPKAPYFASFGAELRAGALHWLCVAFWVCGYPDRALAAIAEAIEMVRRLDHPFSVAAITDRACWIHHFRREWQPIERYATETLTLSREHGFGLYLAAANIWLGKSRARLYADLAGVEQAWQGLLGVRAAGTRAIEPMSAGDIAELHIAFGAHQEALALLAELADLAQRDGERWWDAELLRLKGEALLLQDPASLDTAEAAFRSALAAAAAQSAKSLELRAATSLASLLLGKGQRVRARDTLAPVYEWFTEGHDSGDLRQAAALLAATE